MHYYNLFVHFYFVKTVHSYFIILIHKKDDSYQTSVEVMCSSHFLGWIFSLGSDIEILAPQNVRELYVEKVEVLLKKYR